ncbi:GDP-mannose 4,6-dehydratase [Anaerolineales bacterium]
MRVLITGATGFVGKHLATDIYHHSPSAEIHGTNMTVLPEPPAWLFQCHSVDFRQEEAVNTLIAEVQPDCIYHLAAQAFVPRSFEEPWETLENNILSELNIFLACIRQQLKPRTLIISSAEIYGDVKPEELPLDEDTLLRPANPYSVSKVAQDLLGLQYYLSHQLPIMRARPFNHIGPGQNERFVAPAFSTQIARIERGLQEPVIRVGNLAAERDFTDVRDIVRAYRYIIEKGQPGQAYNIATGQAHSIQYLLDTLLSFSDVKIEVQIDPDRLRPIDVPCVIGDSSALHQATGWAPKFTFEQTLKDVLDDCRNRVKNSTRS